MALRRGTVASSILFAPSAVTSLTLTASDRTITATWSAPTDNGGSPITSYTVETQLNSEGWVNRGAQSSGVSFTVRNNTVVTARSYQVRVTANNVIGAGTSAVSNTATPNFGTPATPTGAAVEPTNPNNGTNGSGARQFTITYSPLVCSAFSNTQTFIARAGYEYTDLANYTTLNTTSSTANQGWTISTAYQAALSWYTPTASIDYYVFTRTWNTDGDYKDSAVSAVITTTPTRSYGWVVDTSNWGGASAYNDQTGEFVVTGNTYSNVSAYFIPGQNAGGVGHIQYSITSLTIQARVVITGITICTSSRNFLVDFSGTSTSAGTGGGTQNCLTPPFSNNSGTATRSLSWNVGDVGFGNAGAGRIRVRGAGSIGTWSTSPDQRIRVRVLITGEQRSWVVSSRTDTYYY
jgi:hypothetical protein